MGTLATALKWIVALILSAIGTIIVMASLGLSTQLMSWSLVAAAHGDDVLLKYQILLAWTLSAASLAFLARIIVLIKRRKEHDLRWTEYPGHALTSGVLSGGLAYGAVVVLIAAMKGLGADIETLGETDRETLANLTLMAIIPTFFVMMVATLTAHKNIVEIPKSSPPDQTLARMNQHLKLLVRRVKPVAMRVKGHRWRFQDEVEQRRQSPVAPLERHVGENEDPATLNQRTPSLATRSQDGQAITHRRATNSHGYSSD